MSVLQRRLNVFDLTLITIGSIIGSGIFRNPAVVANRADEVTIGLLGRTAQTQRGRSEVLKDSPRPEASEEGRDALRRPGGTVDFIDIPGGVMLGVGPSRYPATDITLPPGSVLALYTDGLIEHPGQDIGTGMSHLARTLAASPAQSLDQLCDSVLASLGACARDDIALLLARTTAETARCGRQTP